MPTNYSKLVKAAMDLISTKAFYKEHDINEIRIKPCPKCGDAWMNVSDGDYYSGYEAHGFRVNCKCGFARKTMPFFPTRKEAIIKWNEICDRSARGWIN